MLIFAFSFEKLTSLAAAPLGVVAAEFGGTCGASHALPLTLYSARFLLIIDAGRVLL